MIVVGDDDQLTMTDEVHFSTDVTLMTHVITGAVDSQAQAERQYPQQTLYTQTQYEQSQSSYRR